jgi:hypothetical protein
MWFGLLDQQKAGAMITQLAAPEHQADWGMRIILSRTSRYDPGGITTARFGPYLRDGHRLANTAITAFSRPIRI